MSEPLIADRARAIVASVTRDLGIEDRATVSVSAVGARAVRVLCRFSASEAAYGFEISPDLESSLAVQIAEGLQQASIEEFWRATPRCPAHEHPLRPIDDAAAGPCWSCPASAVAPIPFGAAHKRAGT